MSYLLRIWIILCALISFTSQAQTAEDEEQISMEFLEFLSEWETELGDWVGPERFEDDSFDQLYEDDTEENNSEAE
jgi:hypothetical protein